MSKVLTFRGSPANAAQAAVDPVPPERSQESLDFEAECFGRFRCFGKSNNFTDQYIAQVIGGVRSFLAFAGPLETVISADYERWSAHCADVRKNKPSTIRTKQKYVRTFLDYLIEYASDLQNKAVKLFGDRIQRFAHAGNSIVHVTDDATPDAREAVTVEHMNKILEDLDHDIEVAANTNPRELRQLMRDKAMFFLGGEAGIRSGEFGMITWSDFHSRPLAHECGQFALITIRYGKGSRGSGKRARAISIDNPLVADVMEWYRTEVYPLYGVPALPGSPVFLSERGEGISAKTVWSRFRMRLTASNLLGYRYSPHSLRHTMITQATIHAGLAYAQNKAGHKSAAVTARYTHVPLEHFEQQSRQILDQVIKTARQMASLRHVGGGATGPHAHVHATDSAPRKEAAE